MDSQDICNLVSVETSSGHIVKARYLNIDGFELSKKLCFELHRVFLFYSKDRVSSQSYLLNQAIETFFEFLEKHNEKQPDILKINSLSVIGSEIFRAYIRYCQKNEFNLEIPTTLKAAIVNFAEYTKLIPIPSLPRMSSYKKKTPPTEPLSERCYGELTTALLSEIDRLYVKVSFIEKVKLAEPYTLEGAFSEIFPPVTKERIFKWYEMILEEEITTKLKTAGLKNKLKHCTDVELSQLAEQKTGVLNKFKAIYKRDKAFIDTSQAIPILKNGQGIGIGNWNFNIARGLKTLLVHGYPMEQPLKEIERKYSCSDIIAIDDCKDIVQLLMLRINRCRKEYKHPEIENWDSLLGAYFPSMIDAASIYLMLAIQSGWNKETILSIDPDNFEHVLTGALNENQSVIFSEKHRGQDAKLPYSDSKEFIAPSNKDDKYSIYNIIQLAKRISAPLAEYEYDYIHIHKTEEDLNPLFLCLRYYADWISKGGRNSSLSQQKAFNTSIKHFIRKHQIKEHGKLISSIGEITLRTRITWMQIKRKKLPLTVIRLVQGHNSKTTTDKYYDNSGIAKQERKRRLRLEQEEIVTLLRNREFKGIIGIQSNTIADAPLKIFHIPGHKNDLWACANQYEPTWPRFEQEVTSGEKCYSLSNCIFCKQIRLFEDSVPYLMERLIHIEESVIETDIIDEEPVLNDERIIIESILDNWDDDDHIKSSARYQRINAPLLPRNLNDLKIIFEDDND